MTTNQTIISGFRHMRRIIGSIKHGADFGVIVNDRDSQGQELQFVLGCGSKVGETIIGCTNAECKTCNPMTAEKAAVINQRFLRERGYE